MAADGYLAFFLSCPAVFVFLPFPTAPFNGDSLQCSSKSGASLAAWLGLPVVSFHGHPRHRNTSPGNQQTLCGIFVWGHCLMG